MLEVEIGARINFEEIEEKLISLGAVCEGDEKQIDTFGSLSHRQLGQHEMIRLREKGREAEVTYKESVDKINGVVSRKEISFKTSTEDGKMFLEALGVKPWVIVDKIRRRYKLKDFNIGLDRVSGLGDFIEIELMGVNEMIARKRILSLMEKIGILEGSFMEKPYYVMLLEKT